MQQMMQMMTGLKSAHVASFFRGDSDRDRSMVPFVLDAIDRNAKCVYILGSSTRDQVVESLMKIRDIQRQLDSKQITFLSSEDTYLKGGRFEPERMLAAWKALEHDAIAEGYTSLHATGETSWYGTKKPGVELLREYEARLNGIYPGIKANILCQYEESEFDSEFLLDIVRAHPWVVVRGELCSNPYFTPADELLSWINGKVPKEIYGRTSTDILKRARLATIHGLELRDSRRAMRKMSILGGTALDDIQSQVSIVDFYAELAKGMVNDRVASEYLEKISANCSSLQKRIDFMRSYRAVGESESRWWNMDEVLDSAEAELEANGIELMHKVGKLRVWADGLFERAIRALLENTPDLRGHDDVISIRSSELRNGLVVSIEHEGMGLPEDVKTKVFECGYRHGLSDGYGLFLAGEILSSAGMTLREIGTPGKETRFEILIPHGKYQIE